MPGFLLPPWPLLQPVQPVQLLLLLPSLSRTSSSVAVAAVAAFPQPRLGPETDEAALLTSTKLL